MNKRILESWTLIDGHLEKAFKSLSSSVSKGNKAAASEVMKLLSATTIIRNAVGLGKDDFGNIFIKPKRKTKK